VHARRTNGQNEGDPDVGRRRAVIENVKPCVDAGRFPIKRCVGDRVVVEADVFTDGHDAVRCKLTYRPSGNDEWAEVEMAPLVNDRWRASFPVNQLGRYAYTLIAWVDHFLTWRRELERRLEPADVLIALQVGAAIVQAAALRASLEDQTYLARTAQALLDAKDAAVGKALGLDAELAARILRYPDRQLETRCEREYEVIVDPVLARFGAWYEFFPRSASPDPARHGTFKDCEARLPYVAQMGFDVLYLPPIHPIGRT
jgi:starch synthase (maltosyl-transferring)